MAGKCKAGLMCLLLLGSKGVAYQFWRGSLRSFCHVSFTSYSASDIHHDFKRGCKFI